MLSVILPAYNEEQMIEKAAAVIGHTLRDANIPYEIIFVDDGSLDDTWNEIVSVSERNENVRGVHFSRNFGKEAAIMAGLTESNGDCCVVMDCDLQHPPEKILEMYQLWQQGYEVVEGQKRSRGTETAFHAWAARRFYAGTGRYGKRFMLYVQPSAVHSGNAAGNCRAEDQFPL